MTMIEEEKKVGDDLEEAKGEKHELPLSNQQQSKHIENTGAHAHHSGVLKSMLERAVANRFSSKPIDIEKNKLLQQQQEKQQQQEGQDQKKQIAALAEEESKLFYNSIRDVNSADIGTTNPTSAYSNGIQHYPTLTLPEQAYLEKLLISHDAEAIRQATVILSDQSLFPMEHTGFRSTGGAENELETSFSRRDSKVQRLFFRMHEMGRSGGGTGKKSQANNNNNTKRRLGWNERFTSCTVLESQTSMSSLLEDRWKDQKWRNNSILVGVSPSSTDIDNDDTIVATQDEDKDDYPPVSAERSTSSTTSQDISSWLMDGGKVTRDVNNKNNKDNEEEISGNEDEVTDDAKLAAASFFKTSFAILGTAAEDASCHPHVLSPPLMESLLEFVPETLSDYHFWIKYSMVRDGYNLYTFLRHVRTSVRTILAIETTDGQVFGAFTSQPWRLVPELFKQKTGDSDEGAILNDTSILALTCSNEESFYGSKDTFLWKMRQSRFESQALVRSATVEQAILMESELAVYPFTGRNNCVQHCSTGDGIGLGENAAAIHLDPSLRSGSTAASETFGNPCLLDSKSETPVSFQVANLEVWTLTPHDTVKLAEQAELSSFFETRHHQHEHNSRLDIFGILVGGPKAKR